MIDDKIRKEATRLHDQLHHLGWTMDDCLLYAPMTQEIRELAAKKNAVILAHNYQTPDIIFGISDYRGDSLGLSEVARDTDGEMIVFCGVRFMAETAKILSPQKVVLHPAPDAGCSLSESITAEDVRKQRKIYPDATFICYVNTTAEVKAECDYCCTSANALSIVEGVDNDKIVFLPDRHMAANLRKLTEKTIIDYDGTCIVHDSFTYETALTWKRMHPNAKLLVHTESHKEVVDLADLAGGTGDMVNYVKESDADQFMLVTECGLSDRLRVEYPDKEFLGTCSLCPYMKRVNLSNVLQALKDPRPDQIIEIEENIRLHALRGIEKMLNLTYSGANSSKPHSNVGDIEN